MNPHLKTDAAKPQTKISWHRGQDAKAIAFDLLTVAGYIPAVKAAQALRIAKKLVSPLPFGKQKY